MMTNRIIQFEIPEALPGQNVLLRMHWRERMHLRLRVAWLVKIALMADGSGWLIGSAPIQRCRITITRRSRKPLDGDNAPSSAKSLLDVLQPYSKTHPDGLGVIANDSADCIVQPLSVKQEHGKAAMIVVIEELR